jgi:hypothetical protein
VSVGNGLRWWLACALALGCTPAPVESIDVATAHAVRGQYDARPSLDWNGFYTSPQSGLLELRQHGDEVTGRYELVTAEVHVQGTLTGRVRGNLARVVWEEQQEARAASDSDGAKRAFYSSEGYFYRVPDPQCVNSWRLVGQQSYFVVEDSIKEHKHSNVWTATRAAALPLAQ